MFSFEDRTSRFSVTSARQPKSNMTSLLKNGNKIVYVCFDESPVLYVLGVLT
jgi:hypothetical protein